MGEGLGQREEHLIQSNWFFVLGPHPGPLPKGEGSAPNNIRSSIIDTSPERSTLFHMSVAVITGSAGLIGSETARFLHAQGMDVVGIDNNMREYFFGADGSTQWNTVQLQNDLKNYTHHSIDIRDEDAINKVFSS